MLDDILRKRNLDTAKVDADVEQAKARRRRDQDRIDQGLVSNPKDLERMQHEMVSLERRVTSLEDFIALTAGELARHLPPGDRRVELAASPREALVMALAGQRTPIICVAGSLFLIGEVLAQLPEKQQDFLATFGPADSMKDHARAPRPSQS